MNVIICKKGSDEIVYFVEDCIQDGRNFIGANTKLYGVKEHLFDIKWTDDTVEPILNKEEKQIGWAKTASQIIETEVPGTVILQTTEEEYRRAFEKLTLLSNMNYNQLDTYIDNHVTDLPEAKIYLKKLSKVVLALIKISMRK